MNNNINCKFKTTENMIINNYFMIATVTYFLVVHHLLGLCFVLFITGRRTYVGLLAPAEAQRGRVAVPRDRLYYFLRRQQHPTNVCPGLRGHGEGTPLSSIWSKHYIM